MMGGAHHPVPNAEVIVRTGGGGWGDRWKRDPAAVRADVEEELVSQASRATTTAWRCGTI